MRQSPGGLPRPRMSRLAAVIGALAILLSGVIAPPVAAVETTAAAAAPGPVKTANLAEFQPGHIISDEVFFNSGTMTTGQIQSFLEARVPSCQSGYVCLKDKYDTTRTTAADAMCGAYSGGGAERASTIIYKVAQACGINPQVIIVTLQKEQGLVTHTNPSESRYTIAMGQGCPDTAACDTRYYGFFNQVYGAAWQLKRYANPPGTSQYFTWYAPGRVWNVRYHPNAACGSSPVLIQNQATANLYYYTPYQPNAAALAAGYAAANNACSSYGNRNFYNYFTDWFGSTVLPSIASIDGSTFVMAVTSAGAVLGYPFRAGRGWGAPITLATVAPGTQRVLSVGDFDGDGRRDLVGVTAAGALSLYRGDGSLAYGSAIPLAGDWAGAVLASAAGDFDGDGAPDLFTTDSAGNLLLWRNTGWGRLMAPIVAGTGWGGMNLLTGGADLDGDGRPDLVARSAAGGLHLYTGNGSGSWKSSLTIGQGWGGMTAIVAPGDFSGDGIPDILARDGGGSLWYYYGTGGGRIAGGAIVGSGWHALTSLTGTGPATGPARVRPAGTGDVDGDRAADVTAVTSAGQLLLYRGDGRGSWRGAVASTETVPAGHRLVTMGDFNGDGISDLGRIAPDGTFVLLAGRRDGTFVAAGQIGNGWGTVNLVVGGIDWDGDGTADVIGRVADGSLVLYRGNGAGGWRDGTPTIGNGWASMVDILYAGDFDGDRAPDVIVRASDSSLWLYPTTGRGNWGTPRQIGVGWGGFTSLSAPGNFDGAGGPDILARAGDGTLTLYRGDGRGGWSGASTVGYGWNGMSAIR